MKTKTFLPIVALCAGTSLWAGALLADDPAALSNSATSQTQPWILSKVLDAKVKDKQGDNLGQIKDIVVEPSGRASFAVIKLSGDVGPQGSYAPVPWSLLKPAVTTSSGEPKTFILNVDRNQFVSGQKYFLNHWPDYNEATWGPQVYSYYGLDYNAQGSGVGATGTGTESLNDTSTISTTSPEYSQRYGPGRYGPTRPDGTPIDNGTAPDGKGTFVRGPHWW